MSLHVLAYNLKRMINILGVAAPAEGLWQPDLPCRPMPAGAAHANSGHHRQSDIAFSHDLGQVAKFADFPECPVLRGKLLLNSGRTR